MLQESCTNTCVWWVRLMRTIKGETFPGAGAFVPASLPQASWCPAGWERLTQSSLMWSQRGCSKVWFGSVIMSSWSPRLSQKYKKILHDAQTTILRNTKNLPRCRADMTAFLPPQVFLKGSETLSGLLCKWDDEVFLSPDRLSLEDSQSLLKLCVFLGQPWESWEWVAICPLYEQNLLRGVPDVLVPEIDVVN